MPIATAAEEETASRSKVEDVFIDVLKKAEGEIGVLAALATVRQRVRLGSFDVKEALWSLLGNRTIELTPRRTLRIL